MSYSVPGVALLEGSDSFLAATLLPAMRMCTLLRIAGDVSPQLLRSMERIQSVYRRWDPSLAHVEVEAQPRALRTSGRLVAAFFTGGVDSFHTALTRLGEIDALVFVHGFDIAPWRSDLLARVSRAAEAAASELGKPLIQVRTSLKLFSRLYLPWSEYHGAALASVALLFSHVFRKIYVPGALSHDCHHPYGSHPALDHLFGTDGLEICYDGWLANRFEKTSLVARSEVAMRWLRVCNARGDDGYNCGRCEKCLRTMAALRIAGALGQCRTLPNRLDLTMLRAQTISGSRDMWMQNLVAAENRGCTVMADVIRRALSARQ